MTKKEIKSIRAKIIAANKELKTITKPSLYTPTQWHYEKFLKDNNLKPNHKSFYDCCIWYTKKVKEGVF